MNVDDLINNGSFCSLPWLTIHTTPSGKLAPCCISKSCGDYLAPTTVGKNLIDIVNHENLKNLRLDMLAGKKNPECENCYKHETENVPSARQSFNVTYRKYLEDALENTNLDDGTLDNFKMKHFDMRFSNICNFKCRTCNYQFSTQWEQEDIKNNIKHSRKILKTVDTSILNDVLEQIPNFDTAYFAGGEPLITEQHYMMLEEMIRISKTDIKLTYNTNISNLKFKNKDLLGLWKHFKYPIHVSASLDHYGERAEYIRHGTDWAVVEDNFRLLRSQDNLMLSINTVMSIFNVLTLDKFYQYLSDRNLLKNADSNYFVHGLYCMSSPEHLSCHVLPEHLKKQGDESLEKCVTLFIKEGMNKNLTQMSNAKKWIYAFDRYDAEIENFRNEIERLDNIRNENFSEVFPELAELLE